ncbi:MAG: hypothetical protein Q8M03_16725 [Legionella sp.]|nr:hypothetical protein [Legionella sp.]
MLKNYFFATPPSNDSVLEELSDEALETLTRLYPFPEHIERTPANFKRALIHKLPKTDLHVHGEAGFLMDVALARKLAKRNKVLFPEELVDDKNTWKYRGKDNFLQFIADFLAISALICTPEDIEEVAYAFYRHCYDNNVIFALPGISWVQCKDKMSFAAFNHAYNRALLRGMNDFGDVSILRLRYYLERHIDDQILFDEIFNTLESNPNPFITTVGLAGGEENHPLKDFEAYYYALKNLRKAENAPWYFLTAHMEAYSDANTIEQATDLLDWIAHGRNAADSSDTIAKMKAQGMSFEICPLSDINVYPNEIPTLEAHHQLKILMSAGLVSLNSDDPGFFGSINDVYQEVFENLPASFTELLQCTERGVNPAAPHSLQEMERVKNKDYRNYMAIVKAGTLKIDFFRCYWALLPMLTKDALDVNTAEKLLAIDLKTPLRELSLMEPLVENDALLKKQLQQLIAIKRNIETLTQYIKSDTEAMYFTLDEGNKNLKI